jgi:hypothetical protein
MSIARLSPTPPQAMIARLAAGIVVGCALLTGCDAPSSRVELSSVPQAAPPDVVSLHRSNMEDEIAAARTSGHAHASYAHDLDISHAIDLTGDGTAEWLVFSTLEGTLGDNHWTRTLSVYRQDNSGWRRSTFEHIGGKGEASVGGEDVVLEGQEVVIRDVLTFAPDDAMCCPSQRSELRMKVDADGRLTFED